MPKRRHILILLACGLAAMLWVTFATREPVYRARRLTYWVNQLGDPSSAHQAEASDAIRHIGTNAVPYLQTWVYFPATPDWVRSLDHKLAVTGIDLDLCRIARTQGAVLACRLLGPDAKGVVQYVERQMYDPELLGPAEEAASLLPKLGREAIPALTRFMTNQDPRLHARWSAILEVRELGPDAAPLVPILIQCLQDRRTSVAACAARALGNLNLDRPATSVALAKALQDTRTHVREEVTNALRRIAPEYLTNAPPR